jgi:hypothetical protein
MSYTRQSKNNLYVMYMWVAMKYAFLSFFVFSCFGFSNVTQICLYFHYVLSTSKTPWKPELIMYSFLGKIEVYYIAHLKML